MLSSIIYVFIRDFTTVIHSRNLETQVSIAVKNISTSLIPYRRRGLSRRSSRVVLWVCVINMTLLVLTLGVIFAMTLSTLDQLATKDTYLPMVIIQQVTMQLIVRDHSYLLSTDFATYP